MQPDKEVRTQEALEYIGSLLRELRDMAEVQSQPLLTFLISMSYVETYDALRRMRSKEAAGLKDKNVA